MPNNQPRVLATIGVSLMPVEVVKSLNMIDYGMIDDECGQVGHTMVTFSWTVEVDTDCWSVPALSKREVCVSSAIVLCDV